MGSHLSSQPGGPQATPPSGKTVAQGTKEPFVQGRENSVRVGRRASLTHYPKENTIPVVAWPPPSLSTSWGSSNILTSSVCLAWTLPYQSENKTREVG